MLKGWRNKRAKEYSSRAASQKIIFKMDKSRNSNKSCCVHMEANIKINS